MDDQKQTSWDAFLARFDDWARRYWADFPPPDVKGIGHDSYPPGAEQDRRELGTWSVPL